MIVLVWGSSWPVIKTALKYIDPLNLVLQRFLFSALILLPVIALIWRKIPRDRKDLFGLILLGVLTALFELSINVGMLQETSGIGAVVAYTQPFFVFFMAAFFLKEKINATKIAGLVTGFAGVVILSFKETSSVLRPSLSVLLLLAGALFWAVSAIYYKRFLNHVGALSANILQIFVAAIVTTFIIGAIGEFQLPPNITYLSSVLYLGIGSYAVGASIWLYLLRKEDVTVLSSSTLFVPIVAFISGWLLLGETVEPRSLFGVALVLAGLYLVNKI